MGLSVKKILGINITVSQKEAILEEIKKYIEKVKCQMSNVKNEDVKPLIIFTPNPEIISYAQKDPTFKQIVNSAQINLPDGWGTTWAVSRIHKKNIPKINGSDFMLDLCRISSEFPVRIGLIGGRGDVALKTAECLRQSYSFWEIPAFDAPEFRIQNSEFKIQNCNAKETDNYLKELAQKIIKKKINILFVGLGFPKQEYFIDNVKCQMSKVKSEEPLVMMAVGGSFDNISGKIPRAPVWMREKGLEWLYRLIREPWRLSRQLKGLAFFLRILDSL